VALAAKIFFLALLIPVLVAVCAAAIWSELQAIRAVHRQMKNARQRVTTPTLPWTSTAKIVGFLFGIAALVVGRWLALSSGLS
jgi:hypothetical protein